jgi:hypothetical protein
LIESGFVFARRVFIELGIIFKSGGFGFFALRLSKGGIREAVI